MGAPHNPYASALDGLTLDDPVAAFFDFCQKREAIRQRRATGSPPPWTDDPVLQRGRFLNVFREDDRGSQAIFRLIGTQEIELATLVQALFFARWCNRQSTLDLLTLQDLQEPDTLRQRLQTLPDPPWCNVAAYPVEPVTWKGQRYTRLESATTLFASIKDDLADIIVQAGGDVVKATCAINAHFEMDNTFPIFMAVMDVAWFRPDVIDPSSPVPTGIGAAPFLDRLQAHLGLSDHHATCQAMIDLQQTYWPDARRPLQPIDIEYLSCECRKYFSYINGTKAFSGKNVFVPGQSASLHFDIAPPQADEALTQTCINVIAGGPCSGKTTVLEALGQAGHTVIPETSRVLLEAGIAAGKTAQELRADPAAWQQRILTEDHALFDQLPKDRPVFTDTSFIEDLVFSRRAGITVGPHTLRWLARHRYRTVFFLAPLPTYAQSAVRIESQPLAEQLSHEILQAYIDQGYQPIEVPALSVQERVDFIVQTLHRLA